MKFKYFLRGLGAGMLFAAMVCLVAYQGSGKSNLSDQEIIERAKELGMVEKQDKMENLLDKKSTQTTSETTQISEDSGDTTDVSKDTGDSQVSTEGETQEKTTEQTTETTTEEKKEDKEKVKITIEKGSSSYPVCQKLLELGVIENAEEFDTYLVENGYASRIRVGEHELYKGMSYHDIAEAISDPL